MVLFEPQEFGGLEELSVSLAIELKRRGHQTSVMSATWTPADNQYLRRLFDNDVPVIQLPKWISDPASDWSTKANMLSAVMWFFTPLIYILAMILKLLARGSWQESFISAHGWLHGQLLSRFIGPDRRKPLTFLMLNWWRLFWRPDLIHVQGYTSSLLFVIEWAHSKGLPVVYEEHQTPDSQFDWWKDFQQSINKASLVVAVSEKSAQSLKSVCGVTQPIVVRNPLIPDPIDADWQKNKRVLKVEEPIFITTVARLEITKGLNYLIEAIAQVIEIYPGTKFRVYGDGSLRHELLNRADEFGLDGNTIFVGTFSDRAELSQIMANTDIFVMSSILEGQPLSVVEAMAHGCPIVTTSVGGIPELIEDGINGLLCEPKDPQCLADKICKMIDDPVLRMRLGEAARQTYEKSPFQPDSVCDYFISVYHDVLLREPFKSAYSN